MKRALSQHSGEVRGRGDPEELKLLKAAFQDAASVPPDELTHGFHAYPASFYPHPWLLEHGFSVAKADAPPTPDLRGFATAQALAHLFNTDSQDNIKYASLDRHPRFAERGRAGSTGIGAVHDRDTGLADFTVGVGNWSYNLTAASALDTFALDEDNDFFSSGAVPTTEQHGNIAIENPRVLL